MTIYQGNVSIGACWKYFRNVSLSLLKYLTTILRAGVIHMIISSDLEMCKAKFEELIGKRIVCKTNGGRKRIITYIGTVEHCYPNVFTMLCNNEAGKQSIVSFSYIDVLTRTVRVGIMPEKSQEEVAV